MIRGSERPTPEEGGVRGLLFTAVLEKPVERGFAGESTVDVRASSIPYQ
jgi:hypothetical protein